jgi:mRNA interferase MazF
MLRWRKSGTLRSVTDLSDVRRGDVWWVSLDATIGSETGKKRPCVIVQRDAANASSPTTIVCPMTDIRNRKANILNVFVTKGEGGLRKDSLVVCNQVRAIDRQRLAGRMGRINDETILAVDRGLRAILDL